MLARRRPPSPPQGRPTVSVDVAAVRTAFVSLAAAGVAIHAALALSGGSSALVDDWLYCALFYVAAASCAYRGRRGDARGAWIVATFGMVAWGTAEAVFRLSTSNPHALYPPATQTLLFVAFALAYTTLVLLARERVRRFDSVLALDGVLAGLSAAAIAAALLFPAPGSHLVDRAAPPQQFLIGALFGLMFVITVLGMTGWRPGPAWGLIVIAITVNVTGDIVLVHLADAGRFHRGSFADTLFVSSALLLGLAAFYPSYHTEVTGDSPRRLAAPLLSAAAALAVLVGALARVVPTVAAGLAVAALAVMIGRMLVAFELLERSRGEALADELTHLGNRRLLMRHLAIRLAELRERGPFVLALFDLDGFKRYNDTFGHPSGDALLMRLADRLAKAVAPGSAYRMGGDEFCAIIDGDGPSVLATLEAAQLALSEHGDAFSINCSSGAVSCPIEADTVPAALRIADSRMYVAKAGRGLDQAQTRDAVMKMLQERDPALHDHMVAVAALAVQVARQLGLDETIVQQIGRAAELHDIGKIAVPDAILHKPDVLTGDEQQLMRQYPVVGERILRAAPSLAPAAPLVRSSHERWDGRGIPDGLRGKTAPLGARIIAVCDAYQSMRSEHPYRPARTREEALAELERCAGTQFDPTVVRAIRAAVADLASRRRQ